MPAHRFGIVVVIGAVIALGAVAGGCSSETKSGAGGAATSSATTGSGVSSTVSGLTGTTSSAGSTSGAGSSSSSSGGAAVGYCSKPCTTPADCCKPGTPGCPSTTYPNNYTCVGGACLNPQCNSTSDCTATNPKLDCLTNGGVSDCAFGCMTDGDCNAPQTCIGKDDNGKKFCLAKGSGCTDAMCMTLGLGKCINAVCSCTMDSDCTKVGFTKCAQ